MIAGRSGAGKSAFAMALVDAWNLPTLYCSGDMSAFTASTRIASMRLHATTEEVEAMMGGSEVARAEVLEVLRDARTTFSFASPITWRGLDDELRAYVELWNEWPAIIVIDNLMDIEGCEADYTEQMHAMQELIALSRFTGSTVLVMHHASDKGATAQSDPFSPPPRGEIKGGLSEKPELSLTVALNPHDMAYRIACVKQRSGPSDPSAQTYASIRAIPDQNRFETFIPY